MGWLSRWIVNLVVIYGILVGIGLMARRSLIYPFDQTAAWTGDLPGVLIKDIARPDGSTLTAWAAEPEPGMPVIFYFMGNVGHLEYFDERIREFRTFGYGVVAMAYRGGGGTDGRPSEIGLKSDALYLWDNLEQALRIRVPPEQRIIYGVSLGTGIAAELAVKRKSAGVILEAPFTRLCEAVQFHLKIVPACRLMWDEFYPIIDQVIDIRVPILVLHGTEDDTIPVAMGKQIALRANSAEIKLFEGGGHNDLRLFGAGKEIRSFVDGLVSSAVGPE